MRSSKSRSRNKSNRQRSLGNIVNRVFDSSGPEGKVRGTPQQIIEKYLTLARDAQLSNDRVAEQSFFQHAEHYTRMLGEAQREMAERQQQQPYNPNQRQNGNGDEDGNQSREAGQNGRDRDHAARDAGDRGERPDRNDRHDRGGREPGRRHEQGRPDEPRGDAVTQPTLEANTEMAGTAQYPEDVPSPDVTGLPDAVEPRDSEQAQPVETPEAAAGDSGKSKPARARAPRASKAPAGTAGRGRRKAAAADAGDAPEPAASGADSIAGEG